MSISYALFENNLTSDPDDYVAMVQPTGTVDLSVIIDRMIQQGSTVTKADTLGVLEDYHSAIESILLEGTNVTTPIANFSTSIKGVFNGQADSFDTTRHQLKANVNPGTRLRKIVAEKGQVSKKEAIKPLPNPLTYIDVSSANRDSVLTSGGMGQIVGHRLKFDAADANQGIFFVAADGTASRVSVIGRNKPGDLMFMVPDGLAAGDYTLEVRVLFNLDDIRTGILPVTLTVS